MGIRKKDAPAKRLRVLMADRDINLNADEKLIYRDGRFTEAKINGSYSDRSFLNKRAAVRNSESPTKVSLFNPNIFCFSIHKSFTHWAVWFGHMNELLS